MKRAKEEKERRFKEAARLKFAGIVDTLGGEARDPFMDRLQADPDASRNLARRAPIGGHSHDPLSTQRRQAGIPVDVHPVPPPRQTEASQPQLPRPRPDGQPIESSHLELGLDSAILDGEAVVLDERGAADFGALQRALGGRGGKRSAAGAILYAFDLLYLDGRDLRALTLDERRDMLTASIKPHGSIRMTALSDQQLSGLLMWVPMGAVYFGACLLLARRLLRSGGPGPASKEDTSRHSLTRRHRSSAQPQSF